MKTMERIKQEIAVQRLVLHDKRTPRIAKWFLGLAIGYALSPIDLIPDSIPVLGHLDDVIIVPGLIAIALKFIPKDVVAGCRRRVNSQPQ